MNALLSLLALVTAAAIVGMLWMDARGRNPPNWLALVASVGMLLVLVLVFIRPAFAQAVPFTHEWGGYWTDEAGQYRCAMEIREKPVSRLILECSMGADGVFSDLSPAPAAGDQIPLLQAAPFGQAPGEPGYWGQVTWFAVCDPRGPAIYAAAYRAPVTVAFTLRPLDRVNRPTLCRPTLGGGR